MRLSKKAVASRINGARSRGPKTEEGRKRSSMNALRHGLLSNCVLIPGESKEVFDLLLNQHLAKLEPADGPEHSAVEEMVACIWRQRRLWAIETRLLANAAAKHTETDDPLDSIAAAFSDLAKGPELAAVHRYDGRLHRMHQRALQNLFLLSDSEPDQPKQDDQPNLDPEPEPGPQTQNDETNPGPDNNSSINLLKVQSINRPPSPALPMQNNQAESTGEIINGEFRATNWTVPPKKLAG
jgi:hypothetical protein